MEQDGPINFRALRAKFQEEAALAQSMNRPAIAQKPIRLPPPGGHCGPLVTSMHSAVENKTPVVPRVIFRDGTKGFLGKRPISFPPHFLRTSPPQQNVGLESTSKQSFRDRHMPLVLPVLPKEKKTDTDYLEGAPHPMKGNKRDILLPFNSTKAFNVVEETSKDQVCAEPTTKTLGEEKQKTEDGVSPHGDRSTTERPPSSPDQTVTPPFADPGGDSLPGAGGTQFFDQLYSLEKVRKRFLPRKLLLSTRSKSLRSNGVLLPESNSVVTGKHPEAELPHPHPVCLPHIAFVAARPFSKMNGYSHSKIGRETTFKRQSSRDPVALLPVMSHEPPPQPPRKPLPVLACSEYLPVKPPRPPCVDLSQYQLTTAMDKEIPPEVEHVAFHKSEPKESSIIKPDLHAPEFPDFENSEVENIEDTTLGITSLEFESKDHGSPEIPAPLGFGILDFEDLPVCETLELASLDLQALSLNNYNLMCPDPPILPEPPFLHDTEILPKPLVLPHSPVLEVEVKNEAFPSPVLEPEMVGAELVSDEPSATESSDHGSEHVLIGQVQPQPNVCQEENYYEACNNVYEDVENINKFITGQNSRKRRSSPKNPYAVSHPEKEELRMNLRPRHARSSIPRQHSLSNHAHVHSKERHCLENHDDKEQKKKEKHRLEKERKELKEREKKENEMKKKFKITGKEEPLYHAKVMVASKVRKNDLLVKSGETVSIIRTTSCPKGKWLARDNNHKYGYISVMNVELNIKEMLELGKKASQAAGRAAPEGDSISIESRSFNHPPLHTSSFTDDSEEWTGEDETLSISNTESRTHNRTISMPEMLVSAHASAQHIVSDPILEDQHTQHEALQKLAVFFQHKKDNFSDLAENGEQTCTKFPICC
ncbi:uncharacterized protein si:ch211-188c16.1 [Osmerus eperlanus]|uniref:uncharacterized protein si:ch211-188c16.1 n=1 Tax=Osmerus eperlanus TaxID=29151 RepID=UPI002E10988D